MTRVGIGRRLALAFQQVDENPPRPSLWRRMAELSHLAEPLRRPFRNVRVTTSESPQVVMLLPGFATHPARMGFMAKKLRVAGHSVYDWGQGFNWGPTVANFAALEQHLATLHQNHGERIALVGWSLGGIFARELAHRHPEKIAKVITMGSPFSGSMRANNVWRLYQFITGHAVDDLPLDIHQGVKPPVETVAFWSARDGIVSIAAAKGQAHESDRAVELRSTHMGFSSAPEVIEAVLEEMERT